MAQRDEESTGDSSRLYDQFMTIVAGLSQGDLIFPAPFDLATSAALAENTDVGIIAERLFAVSAARDCRYEVTIAALNRDGADPMRREILNTTVASTRLLFALLEALMDELDARLEAGRSD